MGWKLLKAETLTLKRDKALEFAKKHADLPDSRVERKIRDGNVEKLENILREGIATSFQWALVEMDGDWTRMNGHHSSTAIVNVGQDIPDNLVFHVDRYHADTSDDIVHLFRQFDARWSTRKSDEVSGAYLRNVLELDGTDEHNMQLSAKGVAWYLEHVSKEAKLKGDDAYTLFNDSGLHDFFRWVNGVFNDRNELYNVEVIAAMHATYSIAPDDAEVFWRRVGCGVNGYIDDPTHPGALLSGELTRAIKDKLYAETIKSGGIRYRKAIRAWNLFGAGQRRNDLNIGIKPFKGYQDALIPKVHEDASAMTVATTEVVEV